MNRSDSTSYDNLPLINGKSACAKMTPSSTGVAVPMKNVKILQMKTIITETIIPLGYEMN